MDYLGTNNDLIDTINAMRKQESSGYRTKSGLYKRSTTIRKAMTIDAECRRLMVAWCKQLGEVCNYDHHTVAIAINILDRFAAKEPQIISSDNAIHEYKLATMASFYTSVKTHEVLALDPMTMSKLSKGAFSPEDIEEMELRILTKLGWRVNAPTAMAFAEIYLNILLPSEKRTTAKKLTQCQIEHAMDNCQFLGIDASEIAFTATYNAIKVTVGHASHLESLQKSINVNFLPFLMKTMLIHHMQRSELSTLSSLRIVTQPTKNQQSGQSSPRSRHHHLSPRSITMS